MRCSVRLPLPPSMQCCLAQVGCPWPHEILQVNIALRRGWGGEGTSRILLCAEACACRVLVYLQYFLRPLHECLVCSLLCAEYTLPEMPRNRPAGPDPKVKVSSRQVASMKDSSRQACSRQASSKKAFSKQASSRQASVKNARPARSRTQPQGEGFLQTDGPQRSLQKPGCP